MSRQVLNAHTKELMMEASSPSGLTSSNRPHFLKKTPIPSESFHDNASFQGRASFDDLVRYRSAMKAHSRLAKGEPIPNARKTNSKAKKAVTFAPLPESSGGSSWSNAQERPSTSKYMGCMSYPGYQFHLDKDSDEESSLDCVSYDEFTLTKKRMSLARPYPSGGFWGESCGSGDESSFSLEDYEGSAGSFYDSSSVDGYSDDSVVRDKRMKAIRKCI
ncbi:hypothetical protein BSKO_02387 [Bryopsis sp. KO-2023]|nr:hypothetical protein BSKO_02387 [Bryopsis sp. KO-2023]